MTPDTELENLRVMSLLTDLPHAKIHSGRRYVAFAGYVLTYSTFSTIMLWTIAGPKIYHSIWTERVGALQEVRDLNPHDARLGGISDEKLGQHISDQFRKRIQSLAPSDMESLIDSVFTNSNDLFVETA